MKRKVCVVSGERQMTPWSMILNFYFFALLDPQVYMIRLNIILGHERL